MKWWYYIILAGVGTVGFLAGRGSVPRAPISAVTVAPSSGDGGTPEAKATATVDKGTTTVSYSCKVEPPVIKYVKVPSTAQGECPQVECPVLSCAGTATSETPQATAHADAPLLPPSVVTVHETERRRIWGIGLSGFVAAGSVRPGPAVVVSPFPWLDIHVSGSTNGGEADILIRP
jgi:hypothetical protein